MSKKEECRYDALARHERIALAIGLMKIAIEGLSRHGEIGGADRLLADVADDLGEISHSLAIDA